MNGALEKKLRGAEDRLAAVKKSRAFSDRKTALDAKKEKLQQCSVRFSNASLRILERKELLMRQKAGTLTGLNPLVVLARGYAAVFTEEGAVIKSSREAKGEKTLSLRFHDGSVKVSVLEGKEKEMES
jgi:exodeoxyribonuclease VII large subunit